MYSNQVLAQADTSLAIFLPPYNNRAFKRGFKKNKIKNCNGVKSKIIYYTNVKNKWCKRVNISSNHGNQVTMRCCQAPFPVNSCVNIAV